MTDLSGMVAAVAEAVSEARTDYADLGSSRRHFPVSALDRSIAQAALTALTPHIEKLVEEARGGRVAVGAILLDTLAVLDGLGEGNACEQLMTNPPKCARAVRARDHARRLRSFQSTLPPEPAVVAHETPSGLTQDGLSITGDHQAPTEQFFAESAKNSVDDAEVRAALEGFGSDYMTSDAHHPGYVLIPTEQFDRIANLLERLAGKGVGNG